MPFQTIEHPEGVDLDALAQEIREIPDHVDPWRTPDPRHRAGDLSAKTFKSSTYLPRHRAPGVPR